MKKLLLVVCLAAFSANLMAGQYTVISHTTKTQSGITGNLVTAVVDLTTGSIGVYTVPATGQFYITGFYGNTVAPNHSPTQLFGSGFGYIMDAGQSIPMPIPVPPGTPLLCVNADGGMMGLSCTVTGIWNQKG